MTEKMTPVKLQAALATMVCPRMARAYRNRTFVTQNQWRGYAQRLVGNSMGSNWHEYDALGRALYATCAMFLHTDGTFHGDAKGIDWVYFCDWLQRNRATPPNSAWTHAQYEDDRDNFAPKQGKN